MIYNFLTKIYFIPLFNKLIKLSLILAKLKFVFILNLNQVNFMVSLISFDYIIIKDFKNFIELLIIMEIKYNHSIVK